MTDFLSFQKAFQGDLITPDHPDYANSLTRWSLNACRNALVVAFVKSPEDTALAIKYAKDHKLPIAIRGGGHSAAGASSSEGGLVIDLSRHLNTVKIDPKNKLAYAGGGAIWETLDKAAIEHGLATVAGTINNTGIGGLTLGGGYGWLSGAHGLVIDNLVQATVVTADGSILTANETEHSDLFWAIRGGGSNFGPCTELVLRLHPQRRTVYAGLVIFSPDTLEKLVSVIEEWWVKGPSRHESMMHFITREPNGNVFTAVMLFYNGSETEGRANFKNIFSLNPVVDMTKEMPYEEVNTMSNDSTAAGPCACMKGVFQTKPHFDSIREVFERVQSDEKKDFQIAVLYEYLTLTQINSIPNGATPFRSPGYNVLSFARWPHDTPENLKYARELVGELTSIVLKGRAQLPGSENSGYGNYDIDSGVAPVETGEVASKSKAEGLYGDNYPRMQQIKKIYDPELLFNKWFPITPPA